MPAKVVDLPEPVGPVTRTRPRGNMHRSRKIFGEARSSNERITEGRLRNRSEALFLTANARSCAISTAIQGSNWGDQRVGLPRPKARRAAAPCSAGQYSGGVLQPIC